MFVKDKLELFVRAGSFENDKGIIVNYEYICTEIDVNGVMTEIKLKAPNKMANDLVKDIIKKSNL